MRLLTIPFGSIFGVLVYYQALCGQVRVESIERVEGDVIGHVNNPVWSSDSRYLAYELIDAKTEISCVYVYQVDSRQNAKKLIGDGESGSIFFEAQNKRASSQLPAWSPSNTSAMFFLFSDDQSNRQLAKVEDVQIADLPINDSDFMILSSSIEQRSGISGYLVGKVQEVDHIFLIQKDFPKQVWYTDQYAPLGQFYSLMKEFQPHEIISSFAISGDSKRLAICKGTNKYKQFILGDLQLDDFGDISISYKVMNVPKSKNGVLQEPLFNPVNNNMLSYVEIVINKNKQRSYKLYIYDISASQRYLVMKDLFRNEESQVSRNNKTSYIWHPRGNSVIYVNTKQQIEIADLSKLSSVKRGILSTEITKPDQLAISPNGQYLAVVTLPEEQFMSTEEMNTFAQLYIIELNW